MSSIEVKSYKINVERATERQMKQAATMIGGTIEGHAKEMCPVDTGLLCNSITYALGGQSPHIETYRSNETDKDGKKIEVKEGSYDGKAQSDQSGEITVYVGTNIQYAPYQELGAPNRNLNARPFLRPAMENFTDEILQIMKMVFSKM